MALTVREAVFDLFRQAGVHTVFGNPGSTELRMLRDWPADFDYVLGLQESVVLGMAAGHAMGTRGLAVANLHSAGGVGHALGAVFNAYRDRVPVLILAGQQSRSMLPTRPFLAADEPAAFPRPYVKWSGQPERAQDVPGAVAEAYRMAMTPPRGPVFVSVPVDDWDEPATPVPVRQVYADFVGAPEALRELAEALNAARAPALVVGAGVDEEDAQRAVVDLAERAVAAVFLAPLSARSGFPEDHRLFSGSLPPVRDQLSAKLAGHDVVLSIGAPIFKYHVPADGPFLPDGTRLYHLDSDPVQAAWAPLGTSVLSTVRAGVTALLELVEKRDRPMPAPLARPQARAVADPIEPASVFDTLRPLLPDGSILVEEAPSHREEFHARLPITRPGGFLTTGSGALGWAMPVAVGRALVGAGTAVRPGERVVCVIGDGSSMYSIQALWTAAHYRVPVTFLVLNNNGYEAVKQLCRRIQIPDVPGTDIRGIDFVAVAAGLGCPARRVEHSSELADALAQALNSDGPSLVEIPVTAGTAPAYPPAG